MRVLIVFVMVCGVLQGESYAATPASSSTAVDLVVRDLCGKSVALLGESPVHGFGKSMEFKAELVRRLVGECHYNAVFFESGLYDFLNIQEQLKAGNEVSDSMIAAAIGGIWANKEVQQLIPFLREKATSGHLYLGGLDDQLGRGTWAQKEMSSALAASLPEEERARCLAVLQKQMMWQYTSDAPYGPADKAKILECLDRIGAGLTSSKAANRADHVAMVESLKRLFDRDFPKLPEGMDEDTFSINERDRSMYLTFRWLMSQLPLHSKVIIWTATVHAAKELSTVPVDAKRIPLGSYIHRDFGERAFALGFSAYSGSYAFTNHPAKQLEPAPQGSLEARALAEHGGDAVYLSRDELGKLGAIAARPVGNDFTTARWDEVFDGLVIIREERPPEYLKH